MTHFKKIHARKACKTIGLLLASTSGLVLSSHGSLAQEGGFVLEELTVTAQRREQVLSDVPLSISAYSKDKMDVQGVRNIDDIARLTPGISFTRTDQRNGLASNISIRGINSSAGASTTGIYIDDTPIQIRSLGYSAFNSFPLVFDLERVEVLRGPQGTLFGAGSQGGTVRFITPTPDYSEMEIYGRSELSTTEHGGPSYSAGLAVGMPLVEDKVAARVSGWFRRDGGWVDRVEWDRDTLAPTSVIDKNANSQDSYVFRGAISFAPTDTLEIIPSIYYQDVTLDDTNAFYSFLSDPSAGEFNNGNIVQATIKDKFVLPALTINWDLGPVALVSNTSYFDRDNSAINDYTNFEGALFLGNPFVPQGLRSIAEQVNKQENIAQEIRLESNDPTSPLTWVVGGFYWETDQLATQNVQNEFLIPGQTTAIFVADPIQAEDTQYAVYGQADWDITEALTLTVGLRYSETKVVASAEYTGLVVGPDVADSGTQKENPLTPKFSISYDLNDDHMVYATASKGFRIGGYNPRVGVGCAAQLASFGLDAAPPFYDSDSVWNYEVGAKNTFASGKVQVNSSAFYIDWSNIQQAVFLSCGFQFVDNLGSATSKGFDLQVEVQPIEALSLSAAVGYTKAEFDETVQAGPAAMTNLVSEGDTVPGTPWTVHLGAQYFFMVSDDHDGYARLDYQFQSGQSGTTPGNNPVNGGFNPLNTFTRPDTHQVNARLGLNFGAFDVSVFVNNLLDSKKLLSNAVAPAATTPPFAQNTTVRPRTFGITGIVRY